MHIYMFHAARKMLEEMDAMRKQMPLETVREMQGETAISFCNITDIHNVALLEYCCTSKYICVLDGAPFSIMPFESICLLFMGHFSNKLYKMLTSSYRFWMTCYPDLIPTPDSTLFTTKCQLLSNAISHASYCIVHTKICLFHWCWDGLVTLLLIL